MDYYCCDAHHSSYCPECCGQICLGRLFKYKHKNEEEISDANYELDRKKNAEHGQYAKRRKRKD